jgi:predicted ester cyclase
MATDKKEGGIHMSIKDFAEQYIKNWREALLNGKIQNFKALFDPDFVYHASGQDLNLAAYMQHIVYLRTNSKILEIDVNYVVSDRKIFVVSFKGRYNFMSDIPGLPPVKGKELAAYDICVLRIKNSKVIEGWSNTRFVITD